MKIQIPTNCPICDSILVRVKEQLFCQDKSCPAQLNGKVLHFAKAVGIKGLGEKTVEKLNLETTLDIYYLTLDDLKEVVGLKVATKLLNEIEKSKASTFAKVLTGMSVSLIGGTASAKLAKIVNDFDEISQETCKEAGLGEKATNNLLGWLQTDYPDIVEYLPFTFEKNNKTDEIKQSLGTVCITGKLVSYKNKAEAKQELEKLGYTVVDTLTKTVSILIDEGDKGSSKRKTAEDRGIQIITNLIQFINK